MTFWQSDKIVRWTKIRSWNEWEYYIYNFLIYVNTVTKWTVTVFATGVPRYIKNYWKRRDNTCEDTVLNVFKEAYVSMDTSKTEDCRRLNSGNENLCNFKNYCQFT